MATAAAGAQGVLRWTVRLGSSSDASGLTASSNVMTGSSNSAAGLRPLSLRSVPRRGQRATQRRKSVSYQGPSALFGACLALKYCLFCFWVVLSEDGGRIKERETQHPVRIFQLNGVTTSGNSVSMRLPESTYICG